MRKKIPSGIRPGVTFRCKKLHSSAGRIRRNALQLCVNVSHKKDWVRVSRSANIRPSISAAQEWQGQSNSVPNSLPVSPAIRLCRGPGKSLVIESQSHADCRTPPTIRKAMRAKCPRIAVMFSYHLCFILETFPRRKQRHVSTTASAGHGLALLWAKKSHDDTAKGVL